MPVDVVRPTAFEVAPAAATTTPGRAGGGPTLGGPLGDSVNRIASAVKMPWAAFTAAQSENVPPAGQDDAPLTTPTFIEGVKDFFLFNRYARPKEPPPRAGVQI